MTWENNALIVFSVLPTVAGDNRSEKPDLEAASLGHDRDHP